jgi:uncharacterized membrane protein
MKRWFFLVPFLLFGALWLRPAPAVAGLHVCNKVDKAVYVAIGTSDMISDESQGWWHIEPGECKTPIGAGLDTDGYTYYYLFAHSDDDTMIWSGAGSEHAYDFCTVADVFTIDDCAKGTQRSFRRIDTNDSADYTYDLTN